MMKRHRVVHDDSYVPSPLSFWVHRHLNAEAWTDATKFDPPLPAPIAGTGWAQLHVEFDGVELCFSSREELRHFVDILSMNPLPTTRSLAADRGTTAGPNSHWLSRLPARAKPHAFRERLVKYLTGIDDNVWT